MSPAFSSFAAFLNMGGYAVYVWLAVAVAVAAFGLLTVHTLWARRARSRRTAVSTCLAIRSP
ncbi:heme exporter protein CcmD, partial [Pseudomonas aeruginosa]|nr:heme exporter protein CcmD [Pseudomonas aeruginosa]